MGLTVSTNNARAVDGEQDRKLLNRHVMQHLIIGALQESGVNRDNGFVPTNRQTGGKGHRVLLGDCHVEVTIREFT